MHAIKPIKLFLKGLFFGFFHPIKAFKEICNLRLYSKEYVAELEHNNNSMFESIKCIEKENYKQYKAIKHAQNIISRYIIADNKYKELQEPFNHVIDNLQQAIGEIDD